MSGQRETAQFRVRDAFEGSPPILGDGVIDRHAGLLEITLGEDDTDEPAGYTRYPAPGGRQLWDLRREDVYVSLNDAGPWASLASGSGLTGKDWLKMHLGETAGPSYPGGSALLFDPFALDNLRARARETTSHGTERVDGRDLRRWELSGIDIGYAHPDPHLTIWADPTTGRIYRLRAVPDQAGSQPYTFEITFSHFGEAANLALPSPVRVASRDDLPTDSVIGPRYTREDGD